MDSITIKGNKLKFSGGRLKTFPVCLLSTGFQSQVCFYLEKAVDSLRGADTGFIGSLLLKKLGGPLLGQFLNSTLTLCGQLRWKRVIDQIRSTSDYFFFDIGIKRGKLGIFRWCSRHGLNTLSRA